MRALAASRVATRVSICERGMVPASARPFWRWYCCSASRSVARASSRFATSARPDSSTSTMPASTCWPSLKFTRSTVSVTLAVSTTDSLALAVPKASITSDQGLRTTGAAATSTGLPGPAARPGAALPPQATSATATRRAGARRAA